MSNQAYVPTAVNAAGLGSAAAIAINADLLQDDIARAVQAGQQIR